MTDADANELLSELFETTAWGVVTSRIAGAVSILRARTLDSSRDDRERLRAADAVIVLRTAFDELYRSAGEEMPPAFRKSFE
jgi:hypothetical protein